MPQLEVTEQERLAYPTYRTANRVMNGDMTAPVEFFGWTVLRSVILMPGLALAGVRGWRIVGGALAGSTMVSMFALYRTYATKQRDKYLLGKHPQSRKCRRLVGARRTKCLSQVRSRMRHES